MTRMDSTFSHWLIKLGSKVRYLQQHMYALDVGTLERDTNTAQAMLQHMYSYAETYHIDVAQYFTGLTSIEAGLQDLRDQITRRREPRWHRTLNWVIGAINIVANILGLRPLLALFRLPTGQRLFLP
jgi:hypothetical protein